LLLPFSDYPFALESIFVIDPLYTLPLLFGLVYAWKRPAQGLRANQLGLWLSSGYLVWSLLAQQWVTYQVKEQLTDLAPSSYRLLVQPTALNTLVWRIVIVDEHGYQEGFYALSDGSKEVTFRQHSFPPQAEQLRHFADAERLTRFSHGFTGYFEREALLTMADLRMGMQGNYAFEFTLACQQEDTMQKIPLEQTRKPYQMLEMWLWAARRFFQQAPPLPEVELRSEHPC
ncbi:MAG: metal-dependent hydrolase, partial [Alkalimonas sp.]|nr:metal-dependent hydrolase [Alkalimonas sp.]